MLDSSQEQNTLELIDSTLFFTPYTPLKCYSIVYDYILNFNNLPFHKTDFLLLFRVPVAFALGIPAILTAWYLDLPLMIVAQQMTNGLNSFSLMAIPF
ncbi:MAG: TRAP transporter large permease subunit, partial [Promethearchaeota archaeon]